MKRFVRGMLAGVLLIGGCVAVLAADGDDAGERTGWFYDDGLNFMKRKVRFEFKVRHHAGHSGSAGLGASQDPAPLEGLCLLVGGIRYVLSRYPSASNPQRMLPLRRVAFVIGEDARDGTLLDDRSRMIHEFVNNVRKPLPSG